MARGPRPAPDRSLVRLERPVSSDAERHVRLVLRLEAMRDGATSAEADAYADALLPSMYGRSLVLRYLYRQARRQVEWQVLRILDRLRRRS